MKPTIDNNKELEPYYLQLEKILEKELCDELRQLPVISVPKGMNVGNHSCHIENIPLVIKGDVRAVRYDSHGSEVLVYNVGPMESCIISITSAYRPTIEKVSAIATNEATFIIIPVETSKIWMHKYSSWREYTFMLNEKRLNELVNNNNMISEQKREITIQNQSLTDSINYAQRIQNAVLPPEEMIDILLPDYFVLYKPRDIVSGDYYWISKVDGKVVVVVADCTGHGVPGAFMSMLGISLLNQLIDEKESMTAADILGLLRRHVKKSLRQTEHQDSTRDGMDMVAMIFDFENLILEYAGAYNPIYMIRNRELQTFRADRMPVGIHIQEKDAFTNHKIFIQKGDIFYAFSDGYVDQIGGADQKKYLSKNFRNLLLELNQLSMAEQKKQLEHIIDQWKGDHEQIDDILVMGIKV